jgi:hypothetical protein
MEVIAVSKALRIAPSRAAVVRPLVWTEELALRRVAGGSADWCAVVMAPL